MKRTSEKLKEKLEIAYQYYINNNTNVTKTSILYNIDRHILSKFLKSKNISIHPNGKQSINSKIFNNIDTEEKAYWLGFLYADGNVNLNTNTVSLELSIKDKKHLEKFNKFLEKEKPIKIDNLRVRCVFRDTEIKNDLINLGCIPKKSLILEFPDIKKISNDLLNHFIRGYIDGDGSIFISNNNINLSILGTENFLNVLKEHLNFKDQNIYKIQSNCFSLQFSGKKAFSIFNFIYSDCNIFLERKYNKILEYCRSKEKSLELSQSKFSEVLQNKLDNTELT